MAIIATGEPARAAIQRWKRDQELNDRRYEVLGEPRVRRQPLRERRRAHALRDAYDGHAACL
jgi:hypothetical protein